MAGFGRLLQLIHEPPIRAETVQVDNSALWRLLDRFVLRRHWSSLLLVTVLACLAGQVVYVYAWAGSVIADDIIQVHLLDEARLDLKPLEATLPGESRIFSLDEPAAHGLLDDKLQARQGRTNHEKLRLLAKLAGLLIAMELARHLMLFVNGERMIAVRQKVQFQLRSRVHEKLLQLPQSYHDRHSPGRLMTHLFSDLTVIEQHLAKVIKIAPVNVLAMLVGAVIILAIDARLAAIVLLTLPAYGIGYRWFGTRLRVVNANLREREGRLNGHIANRISHFLLVKSFVGEQREAIDFIGRTKPIMRDNVAAAVLNTGFSTMCGIVTGVSITAVLWLGTLQVRDGQLTLGQLLMFFASAGYLFQPVSLLTSLAGSLHRLRTVAGRLMHLLDEPVTLVQAPDPVTLPRRPCTIRFDHVTLRYEQAFATALEDVSFTVEAGQRLCVMGPSGSGKSTLAKLVCRLYDPTGGTVFLDQIDLRRVKLADLRRRVGFVPQEPVIFRGTLDENIRYGSENAPHDMLIAAARHAQIHEFIEPLPASYHTLTSERGLTLSGGQKQRVTLARALLYDPTVLVLDDCTSALDAQTESQLIDAFHQALRNRTAVLISHRVSIAMECDLVLMLDRGRVAEFGSPGQLLQTDGPFAALDRQHQQRTEAAQRIHSAPTASR